MARQVQLRRGTTAQTSTFTGALAEITVDTDKDVVVVHDGSTAGGHPLSKTSDLGTAATTAASDYATAAQGTLAGTAVQPNDNASLGNVSVTSVAVTGTVDGRDIAADGTKLDGIESSATADQTPAQIKVSYESNADTNEFSDAEQTKLSGIEASATADQTGAQIKTAYQAETNAFTDAQFTKLAGVEASADITDTANVTAAGALMDSEITNLTQVKAFDSTDYATSAQGSTADAALPKSGGAMTGAITTNSTFDGVDIATRDGILTSTTTTANAALPKAGGAMSGAITTNSTFDGRDVATDGAKLDYITVTQAVSLDQMEIDIAALANGMVYKGDWDASASTFPGSGSAQIGWFYYVSVAGTVGGISFAIGDNIVAIVDDASTSTYASNWSKHDQTDAVTSVVGLNGSISKSGLLSALNVEDGADVTDATNVTAAGALMDSEVTNLTQVKAFDTTDYATATQGTTADAALPKTGGAMTGAITTNSTFDGVDIATRDGVLTSTTSTANAALPKAGGAMTGAITTSSTFDGRDVATDGSKLDGIEASADVTDTTNVVASLTAGTNVAIAANGTISSTNTTYSVGDGGLTQINFTSADNTKLDGIAANATNVTNNNQLTNGAGYTTNVGDITGVTAGSGITGGGTSGTVTINHADTSSQGSVDNSGATVIQDVTLDTYGHITGLTSHTMTLANLGYTGATNANYITNNNQLTNGAGYTTSVGDITGVTAGTNLTGGGTSGSVTLNVSSSPSFSGVVFAESLQEDYDPASGTTPTLDADNAGYFSLTTSGNTTFTFGAVTTDRSVGFILSVTAGGGHTLTWPSSVDWAGGAAPDAPASGASNLYVFVTRDGGTNWVGVLSSAAYA
tara:strand:- start:1955 stop:4540 length:2586 start_codon:yes stop_codon:yes gene_type:complete